LTKRYSTNGTRSVLNTYGTDWTATSTVANGSDSSARRRSNTVETSARKLTMLKSEPMPATPIITVDGSTPTT